MGASSGGMTWAMILVAFLLNAAVPPLGAWLPDAYPEATVSGAVFMTAFTTKSAVYALIRGFPGEELLVWLDRKSTRLNSSHSQISYAVFCLKKKNRTATDTI